MLGLEALQELALHIKYRGFLGLSRVNNTSTLGYAQKKIQVFWVPQAPNEYPIIVDTRIHSACLTQLSRWVRVRLAFYSIK